MTQETKKSIMGMVFVVGCLVLYFLFPIGEYRFEIFIGAVSFLLLLPILYVKIVLGETLTSLGFVSFKMDIVSIFYLISAIVIGGLLSFFVLSLQWGIQSYLYTLSGAIVQNFGAFAIYELVFVSIALFLITFFSWGFVYAIKWNNPIYSFVAALAVFTILMVDFYESFWVAVPFLVPAFFVQKIRDEKNIVYMFIAVFLIGLILDTLIIKSLG